MLQLLRVGPGLELSGFWINFAGCYWVKNMICGHSSTNAVENRVLIQSISPSRSRCAENLPMGLNAMVRPPVCRLFGASAPLDISRFVIAFIVNSIQRMFGRWRWSKVSKECFERCVPRIANSDASTAIVVKSRIVRVIATLAHGSPALPLTRLNDAPAIAAVPIVEERRRKFLGVAAIANTSPKRSPLTAFAGKGNDRQLAEPDSGEVFLHVGIRHIPKCTLVRASCAFKHRSQSMKLNHLSGGE